ncbi:carbohydrate sulfotransferase 8-like [Clavelina lepadiformis]|uniref:carbohydrate sulfotransferase 8-like n=1 Tax=Clavelina lepadiformis TaxID=159417 RepID=UPI0040416B46
MTQKSKHFPIAITSILLSFVACNALLHYREQNEVRSLSTGENISEGTVIDESNSVEHKDEKEVYQTFMKVMERLQMERKATLDRNCGRHFAACDVKQSKPNLRNLYSSRYKFSVCDIQKCGSSSLLQAILIMEGYYTVNDYFARRIGGKKVIQFGKSHIRIGSSGNDTESKNNWENGLKVVLVRHPFHRLVSAYNDKMLGPSEYYAPLSKEINRRYRSLRHKVSERTAPDSGRATFEDFVNFLVNSSNKDMHWERFEVICGPCFHHYDVIAKFETLEQDVTYLENVLKISDEHKTIFFPSRERRTNDEKVEGYFSDLSKELQMKIYEKYKRDFEIFGYEKPSWLCSV